MSGFDTTPDPQFLRAMQNQSWTVGGALSELVDNSFGPGRGNAGWVKIIHNTRKKTIAVLDNGRGMEAIGRLFQLGNTIGRAPGDIGLYGSGGTMAILWLASRVAIWTLRDGMVSCDAVDWPEQIKKREFPRVSDEWKRATINNTPNELFVLGHGTLVALELAKERHGFYASNAQRDLARNYAPATRLGKELVWTTIGRGGGTQALADPMVMPEDPAKTVEIDLTVDVRGEFLTVRGKIGLIDDLPYSRSRVAIGYGTRAILSTRDCYESRDKSEKYIGTGVGGWLDLDDGWQPYLSTTKDRMNDQPVWEILMGYVFEKIRPLLKQVEENELYLELDDLALDLQEAMNGRYEVKVERAKREPLPGDIEFGSSDSESEDDEPAKDQEDQEGEGDEETRPARSRITIHPQSDSDMEGALCRAELRSGSEILVTVNKDHHVVQEALKSKPVNRMALNMMTTREIATEIVKQDVVLQRLFTARVLEVIDGQKGEDAQAQYIARLLMDRVRRVEAAA